MELAWVVGLVITVLGMEILCFIIFAVSVTQQGFAARIYATKYKQQFYMDILSFIKKSNPVFSVTDNTEVISKQQDEIIRICCQ